MRVEGWERQEPAEQVPPDSPAVDDGRGSVFRSEEFCLDEVDEPVLPLRFGPAGADNQELKRTAVDEGEEGVDGVAAVDPGAEPPAFQEQIDQAFLGPVAPLMVLAQKVSGGRFGGRRVAHDLLEGGGARSDPAGTLDDEPQLPPWIWFTARLRDPVSVEDGPGCVIAGDRDVQGGGQDGLLGAEGLVDGGGSNARRVSDGLHRRGGVALIHEEPDTGLDDPQAGVTRPGLPAAPRLCRSLDRLTHA